MTDDFRLIEGVLAVNEGVELLTEQQFFGDDRIYKVILPASLRRMEESVFAECGNLREAVFSEGIINIGVAAFTSCASLSSVKLPSTLKSIDDGAFLYCESLKSVSLPDGLEEISPLAFQASGLTSVSVPASVKLIGEEAFFECESLTHADVLGEDTVIEENAFGSNYQLHSGYIAPGYPEENSPPAELLYTLLWCSCPDRHNDVISKRAESFIRNNEKLIMERILKYNNVPAMSGIAARGLLSPKYIDTYLRHTLDSKQTELTALLLSCKNTLGSYEEEFEL